MEQVPNQPKLLLIGNGKVATHFAYYLKLSKIDFDHWWRRNSVSMPSPSHYDAIFLAISDDAIGSFFQENHNNEKACWIHFSGSLNIEGMESFHPLTMFGDLKKQSLSDYQGIPFVCSSKEIFKSILPSLLNQVYELKGEQRALYHALCVFSGNFTTYLWQYVAEKFDEKLNLPSSVLNNYRSKVFSDLQNNEGSISGPISRRDLGTIKRHLEVIEEDIKPIYEAVLEWQDISLKDIYAKHS